MAIVRGRVMVTVVPAPGVERTRRLPLISSTARFTASMPTPRPEMSETMRAVLNPGRKMKPRMRSALAEGASSRLIRPFSRAFLSIASLSRPRPSSATSMQM